MNESRYCVVEKELLARIIGTLKLIDVRGYDSMDALVGCVTVLTELHDNGNVGFAPPAQNSVPAQAVPVAPKPAQKAEPEAENSEEEG